jgi:thiol-disulfide isomerase/thioredoxin
VAGAGTAVHAQRWCCGPSEGADVVVGTSRWVRTGARAASLVVLVLLALMLALSAAPEGVVADEAGPPAGGTEAGPVADSAPVVVRYFYADGCPYCAQQAIELDDWERRLAVDIHRYEVGDETSRVLLQGLAAAYGIEVRGVPVTFIGDRAWVGFDATSAAQMRDVVAACAIDGCTDPLLAVGAPMPAPVVPDVPADAGPDAPDGPDGPDAPGTLDGAPAVLTLPLIGTVAPGTLGLLPATGLIAFVDGFNPCSLWVLSVLLAMLLRTGSRRRIAVVGGAFLATTAAVYGLFIAGVFSALSYVGYLGGIRVAVAVLALTFAVVNIKDYIAFKRGFSFTIPDRFKPRIYRGGRRLLDPDRSLRVVTGAAVVMALGVALVELPCTAGFPVLWSGLLADAGVGGAEFGALLGVYLTVYLLDEVALLAAVVVTLRVTRFQEHHGQVLKLVGGTVMLTLGLVMLVRPTIVNGLTGTLAVFLVALVLTIGIHLVTQRIRRSPLGSRPRPT